MNIGDIVRLPSDPGWGAGEVRVIDGDEVEVYWFERGYRWTHSRGDLSTPAQEHAPEGER